jgi:autotransporter translocation and assembly factor TamB
VTDDDPERPPVLERLRGTLQNWRRWRWGRIAAIGGGGLLALVVLGYLAAAALLQGPRLARFVSGVLPNFAGKIEVGSVRWQPRLVIDFLRDRPTAIVVEGLRITDPEGTDVLRAPRLELKVRPRSALSGKVYLSDVKLGQGSYWRFARMGEREGIGFLHWFRIPDDPDQPRPPPPPKQEPDEDGFVFQIINAELDGTTAQFDFPGAWGLELRDVKSPATLLIEGDFVGWDAQGLVARGGGYLKILEDVLPFDRVEVARVATIREAPDNILLDVTAARTGRSVLVGKGQFTGIYGYGVKAGEPEPPSGIDMHAEVRQAADALTAVAAGRKLPLRVTGDRAFAVADLKDVFEKLKIDGRIEGLDVDYDNQYRALDLGLAFSLDLGEPMTVAVKRLGFKAPGGGSLALEATLRGSQATARLDLRKFTTDSYLPPGLAPLAAGTLNGGLRLAANLDPVSLSLPHIDLNLQRRRAKGLPRAITVTGQAQATRDAASTRGVTIRVPGATVTASGRFGVAHQVLGLALRATAAELPRLLGTLGLPPVARSADLAVNVSGTVLSPEAQGTLVVRGLGLGTLPPIGQVDARFSLKDGTARLESLSGDAFGGRLQAQGTAQLYRKTIRNMLKSPVVDLRLEGKQIDLGTLVASGAVKGRVDLQAHAQGPLDAWTATLTLPPGAELLVLGERWRLDGIEVLADARSVNVKTAKLVRPGGGLVEVRGRMDYRGPMQWDIRVDDVPLEGVPGLAQAGVEASGLVSLQLAVAGTPERPQARGELRLRAVKLRGATLGDGIVRIAPTADGGLAASGDLFGRVTLAAVASFEGGGYRLKADASFRNLILEQLVPEMVAFGDARGKLTGSVHLDTGSGRPLNIDLRLQQLELSASRETVLASSLRTSAPAGVAVPLTPAPRRFFLRNAGDVRVMMSGSHLIVDRTRLVTDGGEFKLAGELRDDVVSAEVSGSLNLELLQPFLTDRLESLGGQVYLEARIAGTPRRPLGEGVLAVARPITARLPGVTPALSIPSGTVKLSPTALDIRNLVIEAEGARLQIDGGASFDSLQRVSALSLNLGGEVSGALIEALAGEAISEASGKARIQGRLEGTPASPRVVANLELGGLNFRLRDLGREIAVERGRVELRNDGINLVDLQARVDGQGRLVIGGGGEPGRIGLRRLAPAPEVGSVRIPIHARRLSLRASDSVELDDLGLDLVLAGDPQRGFGINGEVLVASGRYVQDFRVSRMVISPNINESAVAPFYEGKPLLENLALNLRVRTVGDSFMVQNNLAPELHMIFDLLVRGTLAEPRIAGDVRPTDGQFRIFGLRGEFTLIPNVNHVTFVDTKSIAAGETPELNLEAEALVTDSTNREHAVRMRISGPVGQAQIDLSGSGLDRNQALLLLVSGRTTDDTALGGRNPTLAADVSTGTDVIDQLARDSVADLLEPYIDDTLQLLTGGVLNLRPTVGPEGFEVRMNLRRGRKVDFQLSLLRGLENRRQYRADLRMWVADYWTIVGRGQYVSFTPQEGIVDDESTANLELSLDFPIRWPFR